MIDPRALQQHFRKVHQRQEPKSIPVPRIPDPKPLTAIEVIIVPDPVVEQKEIPVIEPIVLEVPKVVEEPKQVMHLVIDVPPPIGDLIINEIEEEGEELEKETETKIENQPDQSSSNDRDNDYDPYGYYSSPRF